MLGAWIYCFKKPVDEKELDTIKKTIQAVTDVIESACGFGGDMACLAVVMPQSTTPHLDKTAEEWEEIVEEHGFEFIDFEAKGKNEFGEAMGVQRVRQALEATDWESDAMLDFDGDVDGFEGSFDAEEAEMNMELFGMKSALHEQTEEEGEGDEQDVEQLEVMMRKMIAIKGQDSSTNISSHFDTDSNRNGREHGRRRAKAFRSQSTQRHVKRPLRTLIPIRYKQRIFSSTQTPIDLLNPQSKLNSSLHNTSKTETPSPSPASPPQ